MTQVRTDLANARESARRIRFEPVGGITKTNVQTAIMQTISTPISVTGTAVTSVSSPYSVLATDYTIYVDTSGGAVTILLQPSAARLGLPLSIKDVTGNALTNNITITPSGAETIDGLAPYVINFDYGGVRINPRTLSYTVAP